MNSDTMTLKNIDVSISFKRDYTLTKHQLKEIKKTALHRAYQQAHSGFEHLAYHESLDNVDPLIEYIVTISHS